MSITPLGFCARNREYFLVKSRLEAGEDPNSTTLGGWTPLHHAARENDSDIIRLLLKHGADPNRSTEGYMCCPLHHAAIGSCPEDSIEALLEGGADPTRLNADGKAPGQGRYGRIVPEVFLTRLDDARYTWNHGWTPEEHGRWSTKQRLERLAALATWNRLNKGDSKGWKYLPLEIQFTVFESLP